MQKFGIHTIITNTENKYFFTNNSYIVRICEYKVKCYIIIII